LEVIRGGTSLSTKLEMQKVKTLPWEKGRWNIDLNFLRCTTESRRAKGGKPTKKGCRRIVGRSSLGSSV
jgi:hypothetical protein